jgi:DNA polymerase III epsilon subunit-like protein
VTKLAFVDIETTGLHPVLHQPWEIAVILRDPALPTDIEYTWYVEPDLTAADATALRLTHFYKRWATEKWEWQDPHEVAAEIAHVTSESHFVGAVPNFDDRRIEDFLRVHGHAPTWHYHLIDIEALMVGYLAGKGKTVTPPWRSTELSNRIGLPQRPAEQAHRALDDARWARDVYDKVMA